MPVIEYTCLVEGDEVLHLIKPTEPDANDNQYVVIFENARDRSLACITGDWEWESVAGCMSLSADFLADPEGPKSKTFAVGGLSRVRALRESFLIGAELRVAKVSPPSGDSYGRLTLRLDTDAQEPIFVAKKWRGIDDRTFRIYRTDEEFERLGRLFQRLEEASFEPVFTSSINDWFMPSHLCERGGLAWLASAERFQRSVEHILEICPAGFAGFWEEAIGDFELPDTAQCPKCKGLFARLVNERWRKICLGCYRDSTPTSYTREQIAEASHVKPWLKALEKAD
jgi:hypothetical protein